MTSSNGNIFRVTGPLCREFTGPGEFPAQRPVTRSFDVFFDLRPNKRLSKQPWGWWFETLSWSLWRHCDVLGRPCPRPPVGLSCWTLFSQPSLRSTGTCHLSRWVRIYLARSPGCILSRRFCELTWWWHRTSKRITARSVHCWRCISDKVGTQVSLVLEHGIPDARIVNSSSRGDAKWVGGEDGQEIVVFAPCDTAPCDNSEFTTAISG